MKKINRFYPSSKLCCCCGNIRKEASRLVTLINDIIRLSQLDENLEPATETVDIMGVAKEVTEVLATQTSRKKVELILDDITSKMEKLQFP